jgi:hypothetical protein
MRGDGRTRAAAAREVMMALQPIAAPHAIQLAVLRVA